jgi:hypothetical protein
MRALFDTGTFLWFISDSDRLSMNARNYIADLGDILQKRALEFESCNQEPRTSNEEFKSRTP